MRVQLGTLACTRGVRLLALDEVDSTNDEARRLIAAGERGPLWIVASRQTKGRGRLGRDWVSTVGNLHASIVVSDFSETRVAPQLGFVAGVAAIRALRAAAGEKNFQLKWPNDLLLDGGKLGGILLECVGDSAAPVAIVGVGVNVAEAPGGLPYEARALSALGAAAPSLETFLGHFSDTFVQTLDVWRGGDGFVHIRQEWLSYASGLGENIRVALSHETVEGRFDTIDPSGRLVLDTLSGVRVIEAGDVLLGPRAAKEGASI